MFNPTNNTIIKINGTTLIVDHILLATPQVIKFVQQFLIFMTKRTVSTNINIDLSQFFSNKIALRRNFRTNISIFGARLSFQILFKILTLG